MPDRMTSKQHYRNKCTVCGSQKLPAYHLYEDDWVTVEVCHQCLETLWANYAGGVTVAKSQAMEQEIDELNQLVNRLKSKLEQVLDQRDELILINAELVNDVAD